MDEECVLSCVNNAGGKGLRINAWAPGRGAIQRTYSSDAEGGGAALVMLGKTHILCALKTLPLIYIWHVKKEQVAMKIACPGLVRMLATTPDGVYCAAAIAEKIYIWQVSTGYLLAVKSGHYQCVSVMIFTDDGQWLISGGDDGRVLVWSLRRLLSEVFDSSNVTLPLSSASDTTTTRGPHPSALHNSWSDHALPVTSLYCGCGGLQSRLATASLDQTCKLYDLVSGQLLCSMLFGFSLTAVVMDTAEQWLFVGGATGKIARVNLMLQRTAPSHSTQSVETDSNTAYKGHKQTVVGLAVCREGLVSSSEDGTCRVWDISSGQTTRLLQMKGGVVQSQLVWGVTVSGKKTATDQLSVSISPFQKQLWYNSHDVAEKNGLILLHRTLDPLTDFATTDQVFDLCLQLPSVHQSTQPEDEAMTVHRLREDLTQLRDVNRTLYSILADKTSHPTTSPSSSEIQ